MLLSFSVALAACVREPDVIEPGERLPSDPPVDTAPRPRPWLDFAIPAGEEDCELRQVERLLNVNCGECHAEAGFYPCSDCFDGVGPPSEPISIAEQIQVGRIEPGDAEGSRFIIRIRSGEMPPGYADTPPMSDADVAWLASFIDSLEPGEEPSCAPAP